MFGKILRTRTNWKKDVFLKGLNRKAAANGSLREVSFF